MNENAQIINVGFKKPDFWKIPATDDVALQASMQARAEVLRSDLKAISQNHPKVKLASSLAAEDLLLTDVILQSQLPIKIFCLDTGRLNPETLAVIDKIKQHYGYAIEVLHPNPESVLQYIEKNGENAFYDSIEQRKACCHIRKVEPLSRALAGQDAWITGQRREQAVTRSHLPKQEFDAGHGIEKYNPLSEWSEQEVWAYLLAHQVPLNDLHLQGYPSIGCEPCTRPVKVGEDLRAGRWWWESQDSKECGLHSNKP